MDTSKLKRFATEARNILIQGVKQRLSALGFTDKGTATEEPQLFEGGATFMGEVVSTDFYHKWMSLQQAVSQKGIKVVEEEAAYTWFNRLVAIRIMVKNGIIAPALEYESEDSRTPLLVSEARQGRTPSMDERTQELWNGMANDDSKTNEQFALLIVAFCHATPIINKCFGHIADYTELLLPTNILAEGGFVDMMNHTDYISEADYQSPELIGWLYQFYISQRKDEVMAKKGKYTADEIPAATQIFTPNWIVKYMVQNTVGRIYLDNNEYADDLKENWKYLVESEPTPEADKYHFDDLADLKVADLACGSGHILNEAFDILFQLYTYEGYSRTNAIEQIFHSNLTGIDLDTRAKQLAMFALLLKACQKDNSFADAHCLPRIYDMPVPFCQSIGKTYSDSKEEAEIIRPYVREFIMADNKEIENEIIDAIILMDDAQTLGSIMKFNLSDEARHALGGSAFLPNNNSGCIKSAAGMPHLLLPYIEIILALTEKYAALVMNPPYMGSGNMNAVLSKYVKDNYKEGKADLCTVFIQRMSQLTEANGKYAFIIPPSWLFLSTFEGLRKSIIDNQSIDSLLHLSRGVFGADFGSTSCVITNRKSEDAKGVYFRLVERTFQEFDQKHLRMLFEQTLENHDFKYKFGDYNKDVTSLPYAEEGNRIYYPNVSQKNFEKIPGCPIGYWLSDKMIKSFSNSTMGNLFKSGKGLDTGNNDKYLRYWSEVAFSEIGLALGTTYDAKESRKKWFPFNKGGTFRRWFGNFEYVIFWENDGEEIKKSKDSNLRNKSYYFKEGITFPRIGSSKFSARYSPQGAIFDGNGPMCFPDKNDLYELLAYMNSSVLMDYVKLLCPTISFQIGDIFKSPYIFLNNEGNGVDTLTKQNISLSKQDWDSHETSWDFEENPLVALAKGGAAFLPHTSAEDVNEYCADRGVCANANANANVRQECRTSYLNKKEYVHITKGHKLPHWYQKGKTQFVTFRLADSLPQSKIEEYQLLKEQWTKEHPQPWTKTEQEEYDKHIGIHLNKWLDDGLGSCVLKRADVRKCLEEALAFYDGKEYNIHAYVIMPNHVHILLTPIGDVNVVDILGRVKGYSAKKINQTIGSSGELWQKDMFDRIVRSDENFNAIIEYIRTNPANLPDGCYSLGGAAFLPHNKKLENELEDNSTNSSSVGGNFAFVRQECRTSYNETAQLAGENDTVTGAKDATTDAETASLQKPHVRLADVEAQYEAIWTEKFMQLHANEEELNRRFIDIYGLQDELTPDVPLSEVTILQQGEISIE